MAETFHGWLAGQLNDPEFAEEYQKVSAQMDSELAAIRIARSDLARKVLEVVGNADTTYSDGDGLRTLDSRGVATIIIALRELFAKEGLTQSD